MDVPIRSRQTPEKSELWHGRSLPNTSQFIVHRSCSPVGCCSQIQSSSKIEFIKTFDVHVTVHRDKFRIIKPTRCTKFSNLFWNETLHVSDSSSVHHQEYFTVHTAMAYVRPVRGQRAIRKHVWSTPLLCVRWKTPDDEQRNCPKHVEFHSKINLRI